MVEAMEIPKGFKKAEVGVIPNDWDVKKLGQCLLKNPDYGINAAAVPYNENLPVYLRITDITDDGRYSKESKVSVNNSSSNSYYLQEGDLVFARTGASVGKTYLYNPKDGKLIFAGFLIRVKANGNVLLPSYLKYFTQTKQYWNWIAANSMRTGQPGINGNEYKELQIPLPPTKAEQIAIATALNDADALITELEKLIAKKKAIKQGVMQELLKPKEGWEVKKLGDLIEEISDGGTPSTSNRHNFGGSVNWVVIEDICDEIYFTKQTLTEEGLSRSSAKLWKPETIILSTGATIGEVGIAKVHTATKQGICGIVVKENVSNLFLKYWFRQNKNLLISMSQGSSIKEVRPPTLIQFEISIPQFKEQTHIAQILSDMDTEIEAMETKLKKYKMLKHGMMQNLLTGKIRLI